MRVGNHPKSNKNIAIPATNEVWSVGRAISGGTITIPCIAHDEQTQIEVADGPITITDVEYKQGGLIVTFNTVPGTAGLYDMTLWSHGKAHTEVSSNTIQFNFTNGSPVVSGNTYSLEYESLIHQAGTETQGGDISGTVGNAQVDGLQGQVLPVIGDGQVLTKLAGVWAAQDLDVDKYTTIGVADFDVSKNYDVTPSQNEYIIVDMKGAVTTGGDYSITLNPFTSGENVVKKKVYVRNLSTDIILNIIPAVGFNDPRGIDGIECEDNILHSAYVARINGENILYYQVNHDYTIRASRNTNINLTTFSVAGGAPIQFNTPPTTDNKFFFGDPASYSALYSGLKIEADLHFALKGKILIDSTGGVDNWTAFFKLQYSEDGTSGGFVDVPQAFDRFSNFPTEDGTLSFVALNLFGKKGSLFRLNLETVDAVGNLTDVFFEIMSKR